MLETVQPVHPPSPKTKGVEGCGEGVLYGGDDFFYRAGKHIPKDKVVHLTWEGNWCGRENGEKSYLIVAFNGTDFTVLEHVLYVGVQKSMKRFKGLSCAEAIALVEQEDVERERRDAAMPRCACGGILLLLDNDQPSGICYSCWRESKKCAKNVTK